MWWECRDCSAGGNNVKSLWAHQEAQPDHRTAEDWETILEVDK